MACVNYELLQHNIVEHNTVEPLSNGFQVTNIFFLF